MATDAKARGTGVATAGYIPGVRLVRAFNALSFVQVEKDATAPARSSGFPSPATTPPRSRRGAARHRLRLRPGGDRQSRTAKTSTPARRLREGHDRQADQGHAEAA
jgi:hypothetical protein